VASCDNESVAERGETAIPYIANHVQVATNTPALKTSLPHNSRVFILDQCAQFLHGLGQLHQLLAKSADAIPEGPLKKLFVMVEEDTKSRLSYITLVAVSNDLAALVADFRKIDLNNNNTLSRKEFREHFVKLGFDKKSVIDALFRYADEDESDEVSFHEYVTLGLCLLVLRILYAFADSDKSGQLSKEEIKKVLDEAHIPENARKKFDHQFSVVDADDSKSLSYQEFVMLVLLMFHED